MVKSLNFARKTMSDLSRLPLFCGAFWLFLVISILTGVSLLFCMVLPYGNGDTAYYVMIGRGILDDHILPYAYAFDHKPWMVYLTYAVWEKLIPFWTGRFFVFSVFLAVITLYALRFLGKFNFWGALFLFFVCGSLFGVPDGNTENITTAGTAIILNFMYRGVNRNQSIWFFISGILILYFVNINYLTAVMMFLPVAFILFYPKLFNIRFVLSLGVGLICGFLIVFAPYLIKGHGALLTYFEMQHDFLQHYGGILQKRLYSVGSSLFFTALFVPVLLVWFRVYRTEMQNGEIKSLLLPLWFISSFPATVLSGHPFNHYYILCFVPALIMMVILFEKNVIFPKYSFIPLCISIIVAQGIFIKRNILWNMSMRPIDYAFIDHEVNHQKVLNIRADQAYFYMCQFRTFDQYAFPDHIDIRFGDHAAERYLHDLAERPPFVMTSWHACEYNNIEPSVCDVLKKNYTLIYSVPGKKRKKGKLHYYSLELYRLKSGQD